MFPRSARGTMPSVWDDRLPLISGEVAVCGRTGPRRRWLGRRGKMLFVLLLLILAAVAWFGLRLARASRKRRAVAAIRELGGSVFYNCRYSESGTLARTGVPGPRWLRGILGADFLAEAEGVLLTEACDLEGLADMSVFWRPLPSLADADLRPLGDLTGLEWLALSGTVVGDAGLENIEELFELDRLWLCSTGLTDAGMVHLAKLRGLEGLWLDDNQIGDAGLVHLAPLNSLEVLSLSRTRVSDAGLPYLAEMSELRTLRLDGTDCTLSGVVRLFTELQNRPLTDALEAVARIKVGDDGQVLTLDLSTIGTTDAGLKQVARLERLEWLHLPGAQVTDSGLGHLRALGNLTLLDLSGTQVTDEGLEHLHGLTKLRTLHLGDTRVTDQGVRELQKHLSPRARIYRVPFREGNAPAGGGTVPPPSADDGGQGQR